MRASQIHVQICIYIYVGIYCRYALDAYASLISRYRLRSCRCLQGWVLARLDSLVSNIRNNVVYVVQT